MISSRVWSIVKEMADNGTEIEDIVSGVAPLIVADAYEELAANYPADIFTPKGKTPDGIAGTALREVLTLQAAWLRGETNG